MKTTFKLLSVLLPILCACSQMGPRTVENPYFNSAPPDIRILSVELTDSATFVTIDHNYIPGQWIRWDSGTYAKVESDHYEAIGGDGIVLGEKLWMNETGDSVYVLKFKPLPFSAKSMDIIEGDEEGWFKIMGIDLTGKKRPRQSNLIPIPPQSDTFPPFDESIAESTVRFHCLNYDSHNKRDCSLTIEDMFGQRSPELSLEDDGFSEYSFLQRGSASISIGIGSSGIHMIAYRGYIAPGETVDIYFDAQALGVRQRTGKYPIPVSSDGIRYSGAKGSRYDAFQNLRFPISMNSYLYVEDAVKDFHISTDDYAEMIDNLYTTLSDSLETLDMNPVVKELNRISLISEALDALVNCEMIISNCYALNSKSRDDYMPHFDVAVMDKANMESFLSKHPVDRERCISLPSRSYFYTAKWMDSEGITGNWMSELGQAANLYLTKAKNAKLAEEDLAVIDAFEWTFIGDVLKSMQQEAEASLEAGSTFTTVDKWDNAQNWLQSLLSQYKGKVVMIDLWNTWCAPCRAAIKSNEPVKNSELNSEDIVWIYIADESSPISDYTSMIKDIRGVHIRLTKEQISELDKYFDVDGIPYYILADREGNYEGRPDLRDHRKYINAIQGLLSSPDEP